MGSLGLLFKQRVRIGVGASDEFLPVGAVELDASIDEIHTSANEITQFPVEKGVAIGDHVRRQPERLQIRGILTDHPVTFGGGLRNNRSQEGYQQFLTMMDNAELVQAVTSLRQYSNMVVGTMVVPRNNKLGNAVEMTLNLRELQTAEVADTTGTTDLGTQSGTAV